MISDTLIVSKIIHICFIKSRDKVQKQGQNLEIVTVAAKPLCSEILEAAKPRVEILE